MPAHRLLMEFVGTVGVADTAGAFVGWTESWYDPTNLSDDDAADNAIKFKNVRKTLLTPGWSIQALRLSQLDGTFNLIRKSRLIQLPPQGNAGTYQVVNIARGADEQPYDAINLSIATNGGSRRAFLMRGIGRDLISAGNRFLNPAGWANNFPNFAAALAGQAGIGMRGPLALRTRSASVVAPISRVTTVAVPNLPRVINSTHPALRIAAPGIAAGRTVEVSGVPDMTGINGVWRAEFSDADPTDANFFYITLRPRRRVTVGGVYSTGGQARSYSYLLDPIAGATPGNGASRRTGRPTQVLRGRRSARRS